jgi:hypothetical protein
MEPGIQFMLRMERGVEAQRHSYVSYKDDLEAEKLAYALEQNSLFQRIFNLLRQRLFTTSQQEHSSGCTTQTKIVSVNSENVEHCKCA